MSVQAMAETPTVIRAEAPAAPKPPSRTWRGVVAAWKWFAGAALCMGALGSVLVAGWTLRMAQREVLRRWWKASGLAERGRSFEDFLCGSEKTRALAHWPNWLLAQEAENAGRARRLLGSLWLNLKLGVQGLFNTWVLTMPACVLWLFAWYDGWNNSFHKGYEQSSVAVSIGLLGSALFVTAMMYVPLAQIRQAVTGDWRSFYQFRLVWGLVRRRWFASLSLSALYAAVGVPFMVLGILPVFFWNWIPEASAWTDAQVLTFLNAYYFWCCVALFPCYVILRRAAAKVYAGAVADSVQAGELAVDALGAPEQDALDRLGMLRLREEATLHPLVKVAIWTTTRAGRVACATATVAFWVAFVAQVFVGQFFNYHSKQGWLNQPLVQLPWFRYVPTALEVE